MVFNRQRIIILLNGTTAIALLALTVNFLIVGFIYHGHHTSLERLAKKSKEEYSDLLKQEMQLKQEIYEREGVPDWESTSFAKMHPLR